MGLSLVVGAPVRDRAWIIGCWFEHLAAALEHETPTSEVGVVLVGAEDDPTRKEAEKHAKLHGLKLFWVPTEEETATYDREWCMTRYRAMAVLRNTLLAQVRELSPDLFWSLDTDILVNEICLSSARLIMEERGFDAVGMKLYMSARRRIPSYGILPPRGGIWRDDSDGVMKVDAIMASKLMSPKAFNVDYSPDLMGEDIGWSKNARESGCRLGWDGTSVSKHVLNRDMLKQVDDRCGY